MFKTPFGSKNNKFIFTKKSVLTLNDEFFYATKSCAKEFFQVDESQKYKKKLWSAKNVKN